MERKWNGNEMTEELSVTRYHEEYLFYRAFLLDLKHCKFRFKATMSTDKDQGTVSTQDRVSMRNKTTKRKKERQTDRPRQCLDSQSHEPQCSAEPCCTTVHRLLLRRLNPPQSVWASSLLCE